MLEYVYTFGDLIVMICLVYCLLFAYFVVQFCLCILFVLLKCCSYLSCASNFCCFDTQVRFTVGDICVDEFVTCYLCTCGCYYAYVAYCLCVIHANLLLFDVVVGCARLFVCLVFT